jgi:hypothetical protein
VTGKTTGWKKALTRWPCTTVSGSPETRGDHRLAHKGDCGSNGVSGLIRWAWCPARKVP